MNQALVDLLQESKRYDMEFEIRQEVSGQTILIHSIAELIYENGLPIKVLGIIRDVTEQKKAEKERKHLEDQLQHAQKMEAIGTLAGGVAHDLNNILGGLVSYPELLLLQLPEDSPLRKSILTIQKGVKMDPSNKNSISEPAVFTRKIGSAFFCLLKQYPKM